MSGSPQRLSAVGAPGRILATAVALLLAILLTGAVLTTMGREVPRGIHLFVSPHPDDELQGWSSVTNDPSVYTAFVVLTRGENTARCDAAAVAAHESEVPLGEAPIATDPVGKGTQECGAARIASWHAMLDAAAATNRSAQLGTPVRQWTTEAGGEELEIWQGPLGARIVLDQGDGLLDQLRAEAGIRAAMSVLSEELDGGEPLMLTTAAYYNDPDGGDPHSSAASLTYAHPDHLAVTGAGFALAPEFEDGAWIVTHPYDARATDVLPIAEAEYERMMGLEGPDGEPWAAWRPPVAQLSLRAGASEPDALPAFPYTAPGRGMTPTGESPLGGLPRTGVYQREFGWLSFPDPWVPGEYALAGSDALFPRHNVFIHATGEAPA